MHKTDEIQTIRCADNLDHLGEQLYVVLHDAEKPVAQSPTCNAGLFRPNDLSPTCLGLVGPDTWPGGGFKLCASTIEAAEKARGHLRSKELDMDGSKIWTHCIAFLRSHTPRLPLVLHGLGFGGLLAAKHFSQQIGDALLMWSPPKSGREYSLRAALMREFWQLMLDFFLRGKERVGRVT